VKSEKTGPGKKAKVQKKEELPDEASASVGLAQPVVTPQAEDDDAELLF